MESRELGRTGLFVSRLGLGLAALGRPGYINLGRDADLGSGRDVESMRQRALAVLDEAWRLGIRYYDAARSYGRAEEFLASWLAVQSFDSIPVVGSKWGYTYTANWQVQAAQHEVKDHSLETLLRQAAESRQVLGTHLKLYQIHSATLESGVLDNQPVLEELTRMREQGCAIGLSVSGPRQANVIGKAVELGLFDTVQATWNVLEPSAGTALEAAHRAGMGVLVKESLANGRLTASNDDPTFSAQRRVLEEIAAAHGTTLDAVSLAAALAQPWADVVLSGAATVEQLRSNTAALEVRLPATDLDRLKELAEEPETYWKTRSGLVWS